MLFPSMDLASGLTCPNTRSKTGNVAGIVIVDDEQDVMLITSEGIIIRMAARTINKFGRVTKGVTLMRFDEGVKIVGVALSEHEEESPEEEHQEE